MINRWQRGVQIYNYPLLSAPFLFFAVLALIGVGLSVVRSFVGLGFTGMNDDFAWGVWKTFNVMTLTALGSGGLAVGLFAWIFGKKRLHIVMRTALASSLLFYGTGMIALTFDVGRPWNLYWLLLPWSWNLHSALFEVAICMSAYVAIFLLFENLPPIVDRLYVEGTPERREKIEKSWKPFLAKFYPFMVAMAYLLPMMHQSSLGSLMVIAGPKVHPLWQTQFLPLLYLIQAIVCGFAAVMFILMCACLAWRRPLDIPVLADLGKYMAWTSITFFVIRMADVVIRGALPLAFQFTGFAALFWIENLLVMVPALLLLNEGLRNTARVLFYASTLSAVGGMLYRFSPTTFAYRAYKSSIYFPSVAELLMCLGYIGLAVCLFIIAAKRFAILPAPVDEWYRLVKYEKNQNPELRINEHGAAINY